MKLELRYCRHINFTLMGGNMTTIPESHLPESYQQPSFRTSKSDVNVPNDENTTLTPKRDIS